MAEEQRAINSEGFHPNDYYGDFQQSMGSQYIVHLDRDYKKMRKGMGLRQPRKGFNLAAVVHMKRLGFRATSFEPYLVWRRATAQSLMCGWAQCECRANFGAVLTMGGRVSAFAAARMGAHRSRRRADDVTAAAGTHRAAAGGPRLHGGGRRHLTSAQQMRSTP